jgi:hypothetical protein
MGRHMGMSEREQLANDLSEICTAYEEGWDSDSDSGDED